MFNGERRCREVEPAGTSLLLKVNATVQIPGLMCSGERAIDRSFPPCCQKTHAVHTRCILQGGACVHRHPSL